MSYFFKKLTVWQKDLFLLIIVNAFIFVHVKGLSEIAGLFFLVIFPGILIQRLLEYKATYVWERIVHSIALSVSFVMLIGLFVNTVLPVFGIIRPLAQLPILLSFDIILFFIIMINAYFGKELKVFFDETSLKYIFKKILPHVSFAILPIMTVAGATILNNEGTNIVTLIAICAIAISLFIFIAIKKLSKKEDLAVSVLYWAALALLFTMSMRSCHVIGWDVNGELQVFRLTHTAMHWSMSYMQDAYNACLSITVLPTIFLSFIDINDEYIYKFLFQFIFALLPVVIFYFFRTFTNSRLAFIAVVMLIGQIVFSHGMPALIRQEFAFLFFALILLILFSRKIDSRTSSILAAIYGGSLIISHYSTTYITIFILVLTVFLNILFSRLKNSCPRILSGDFPFTIGIRYIFFLLLCTVIWSSVITKTSNNLTGFLDYSKSNISESFSYNTLSRSIQQLFLPYPHYESLEKYVNEETMRFRNEHFDMNFFNSSLIKDEKFVRMDFPRVSGLFGGHTELIANKVFQSLKLTVNNFFIIFGLMIVLLRWHKRKFNSSEFIFLAISGFIMVLLLLFLPDALAQYNIDRLYFQLIMIWAFLSVIAGNSIMSFLTERMKFIILGMAYCLLLLFYNSVIFSITGGTAMVTVNNFGVDYEKFYTHDSEVSAAKWLGRNHGTVPIFANSPGFNRLRAHGNVDQHSIFMSTLPSMIDKDSYVFLTHMNVVSGMSSYLFNNEEYIYNTPINFFDKNKNEIYNNGISKIYR